MITAATAGLLMLAACDRRTPEERLQTAIQFYQANDPMSAEVEAEKLIEKAPDDPAATVASRLLAQIYVQQGRKEEAEMQLESALKNVSQKDPMGQQLLADYLRLLEEDKQYKKALEVVEKYQKEYADQPGTSVSLSMAKVQIYTLSGETTAARALLDDRIAQTTMPQEMQIYNGMYLETYRKDQDTTAAVEFMNKVLAGAKDPVDKMSALLTLSGIYAQADDYENARESLVKVTDEFTRLMQTELDRNARIGMSMQVADAYQNFGNLPGARKMYETIYDAAGDIPQVLTAVSRGMVENLLRSGETSATESFLKEVASSHPNQQTQTQLQNFEKMAASGQLQQMAPQDTSTLVMKYRQDPKILWPEQLPQLLAKETTGTAVQTTGTVEAAPAAAAVETSAPAEAPAAPAETPAAPAPAETPAAPVADEQSSAPAATAVESTPAPEAANSTTSAPQ